MAFRLALDPVVEYLALTDDAYCSMRSRVLNFVGSNLLKCPEKFNSVKTLSVYGQTVALCDYMCNCANAIALGLSVDDYVERHGNAFLTADFIAKRVAPVVDDPEALYAELHSLLISWLYEYRDAVSLRDKKMCGDVDWKTACHCNEELKPYMRLWWSAIALQCAIADIAGEVGDRREGLTKIARFLFAQCYTAMNLPHLGLAAYASTRTDSGIRLHQTVTLSDAHALCTYSTNLKEYMSHMPDMSELGLAPVEFNYIARQYNELLTVVDQFEDLISRDVDDEKMYADVMSAFDRVIGNVHTERTVGRLELE